MIEALKFYQGYNRIDSQVGGEQYLIYIYVSPNRLAIVKYIWDAKISSTHSTLPLVLTPIYILF